MDLRELQLIEFKMLSDFADLMDQNKIPYWLAYGTCLGAARHQGFIPWDDDVDLYVRGEDLPKIAAIFQKGDTGDLVWHDHNTVEHYPFVFPKIVNKKTRLKEQRYAGIEYNSGVWLDVFPLFEMSEKAFVRKCQYQRRKFLRAVIEANSRGVRGKNSPINRVLRMFDPIKSVEKLYRIYEKKPKGSRILSEPLQYGDDTRWAKLHYAENFDGFDVLPFEGREFKVPKDYESYLVGQYGDWRTPPPEGKRTTSHQFEFIILE